MSTMKPQTPHEQLTMLDAAGDAYWLTLISWTPAQRNVGQSITVTSSGVFDVCNHGPEWVELAADMHELHNRVTFWRRWADLGPFQIVTEES